MPAAAPLQILLFRHPDDQDVTQYENAVVRAFQGGKDAGEYLATGEDLGIQMEVLTDTPPRPVPGMLDASCHTLTVVFIDRALLDKATASFWGWLVQCWNHVDASDGRHAMLAVALERWSIGRLECFKGVVSDGCIRLGPGEPYECWAIIGGNAQMLCQ